MNPVLGEHFGWLHSARVCGSEIQHVGGFSGVHMHAAFAYGVLYTWCLWITGTNIYFPEEKSWFYVYGSDLVQTVLCQPVWMLLCLCGREQGGAPIQLGTVHLSGTGALSPCQSTLGNTTGALWSQCVIGPSAGHLFAWCSDWEYQMTKHEDLVNFSFMVL